MVAAIKEKNNAMRLSIGTAQFGMNYGVANRSGKVPYAEAERIIDICIKEGIRFVDTAVDYGDSERVLGKIGVKGFNVTSKMKIGNVGNRLKNCIQKEVCESVRRLKIERLYAMLLRYSDLLKRADVADEINDVFNKLIQDGLVCKFGVSVYSPNEVMSLLGNYHIGIIQAPLNIVDRSMLRGDFLTELKRRGIEFHARSVFLQGLLLMDPEQRPRKFDKWKALWDKWDSFVVSRNTSRLSACIGYVKAINDVDRIVIGVDSSKQLRDIIDAYHEMQGLEVPEELCSEDENLIYPYNWERL